MGKRLCAVGGKIAVGCPRLAEVGRLLDEHGGRSKRLERHDDVREGELGLQVELNEHVLLAVLRLPPAREAVAVLAAHDVLDHVAVSVHLVVHTVRVARVAHQALGGLASRAQHTVALRLAEATRRARVQELGAADEQIARVRIAVGEQAARRTHVGHAVCWRQLLLLVLLLVALIDQHTRGDRDEQNDYSFDKC